jgi:putative ABC transport system permease protein
MDHDYMKQYGIKLIAGRYFSREFGTDDSAVIFNKKGFEQLGLNKPEDSNRQRN